MVKVTMMTSMTMMAITVTMTMMAHTLVRFAPPNMTGTDHNELRSNKGQIQTQLWDPI